MKNNKFLPLLLFVFQPFLGFLVALKNMKSHWGLIVFVLFSTLWGYSMTFDYPPSDCYRLAASFCTYPIKSISDISYMLDGGNLVDVYLVFMNYITHLLSDNPKVFYALLGTVYGIFCGLSLHFILKERKGKGNFDLTLLLFLLFAIASFANMSMPRYWTAAWIIFYSSLRVNKGDNIWLIGVCSTLLIHFSYLPYVIVVVAYFLFFKKIVKKKENLIFALMTICFLSSFVLNERIIGKVVPMETMEENEKLNAKMNAYVYADNPTTTAPQSLYRQTNNLVTKTSHLMLKVSAFFLLVGIRRRKNDLMCDHRVESVYRFVLVFSCVAFIMSIVQEVGWRYIWVLWMFLFYLIYLLYDLNRIPYFRKWNVVLTLLNIYNISFMFYLTYRTISTTLFYAPTLYIISQGVGFGPVRFV